MITGPLFVHKLFRGGMILQYQLTVSDRLYSTNSRVHWCGVTKPTQRQIRKMRKISFFIRKYTQGCGVWVFCDDDIQLLLKDIRLHKLGEKPWAM